MKYKFNYERVRGWLVTLHKHNPYILDQIRLEMNKRLSRKHVKDNKGQDFTVSRRWLESYILPPGKKAYIPNPGSLQTDIIQGIMEDYREKKLVFKTVQECQVDIARKLRRPRRRKIQDL